VHGRLVVRPRFYGGRSVAAARTTMSCGRGHERKVDDDDDSLQINLIPSARRTRTARWSWWWSRICPGRLGTAMRHGPPSRLHLVPNGAVI
jgi:hypothetical protein